MKDQLRCKFIFLRPSLSPFSLRHHNLTLPPLPPRRRRLHPPPPPPPSPQAPRTCNGQLRALATFLPFLLPFTLSPTSFLLIYQSCHVSIISCRFESAHVSRCGISSLVILIISYFFIVISGDPCGSVGLFTIMQCCQTCQKPPLFVRVMNCIFSAGPGLLIVPIFRLLVNTYFCYLYHQEIY